MCETHERGRHANEYATGTEQSVARVEALAKLMDGAFVIPGTNIQMGDRLCPGCRRHDLCSDLQLSDLGSASGGRARLVDRPNGREHARSARFPSWATRSTSCSARPEKHGPSAPASTEEWRDLDVSRSRTCQAKQCTSGKGNTMANDLLEKFRLDEIAMADGKRASQFRAQRLVLAQGRGSQSPHRSPSTHFEDALNTAKGVEPPDGLKNPGRKEDEF